jgi:hypothetical protein
MDNARPVDVRQNISASIQQREQVSLVGMISSVDHAIDHSGVTTMDKRLYVCNGCGTEQPCYLIAFDGTPCVPNHLDSYCNAKFVRVEDTENLTIEYDQTSHKTIS